MSFTIIIPSRFGSTRLPGKALLDIAGKPMVQRVYEQSCQSNADEVLVATDDPRIAEVVTGFGGQVLMTSTEHPSGTDRLQEVVSKKQYGDKHVVVNVQGDEPLIPPAVINQVAENLLSQPNAGIATLCERINDPLDILNPNAVKVVRNQQGFAQIFSRSPLPWLRSWPALSTIQADSDLTKIYALPANDNIQWHRHIGIYAYRVEVLNQFVAWPMSPGEQAESLEQLRALDNGVQIHCEEASESLPSGIDTMEDLERVRALYTAGKSTEGKAL